MHVKQPYRMTRAEWYDEREKCRVDGMPRFKGGRSGVGETQSKLNRLNFLLYGVHEWIVAKSTEGHEWAKECLIFHYDPYEFILMKAKEEGFL